ncbi:hypothetical protein GJ496_011482 [Pomphorhynchus laevis]|nr:hypothetical protein GJ496_011482 [Pomphorhynchus laevis]
MKYSNKIRFCLNIKELLIFHTDIDLDMFISSVQKLRKSIGVVMKLVNITGIDQCIYLNFVGRELLNITTLYIDQRKACFALPRLPIGDTFNKLMV